MSERIFQFLLSLSCCVVFLFSSLPITSWAEEDTRVYIARDESPKEVLSYLLGLYGRDLAGRDLPSRPVSGKFVVRSVSDAMSYFEKAYKLNWFEYGLTVYIYKPSDWQSESIYVGDYDSSTDWQELLGNAGLYNSKFKVIYSSQKKQLMVSGPSTYIRLVEKTFGIERPEETSVVVMDQATGELVEKQKEELKPEFLTFPLRYASVVDRKVKLRDQEFSMPGVLSVLTSILSGGGPSLGGFQPSSTASGSNSDPWGLRGVELSALAHPKTAAKAASQLVAKSVRGEEPENSMFPGQVPKLSGNRDLNGSSINIPASTAKANSSGSSSVGAAGIYGDTRTNSIIIYDTSDKYAYYKSIIDKLDVPISMIEVEAMLVELDSSTLNQLGVEFGLDKGGVQFEFPGGMLSQASPTETPISAGASSIVDPYRFLARIRALASNKQAKVLARPTIVTQDNVPAFIDLSETLYLQIKGERVAQVEQVTAGSLLQVTPRLVRGETGKDEIFVNVEIQDGTLQQPSGSGNPSVRNTRLSTQAVITLDKAILIGGYNRQSQTEVEHKLPILGSIPLIGAAFKSTEKSIQNTSRLFLIIPKILSRPAYFAKSTRGAARQIKESFGIDDASISTPSSLNLYRLDSNLSLD